jgi:hypothetical protein
MKYVSTTALTLWVSLATNAPALAGDFYNDQCPSRQGQTFGRWRCPLLAITRRSYGARMAIIDGCVPAVMNRTAMTWWLTLRTFGFTCTLRAAMRRGRQGAKGTFLCRYVGDAKPIRWIDAPVVASRDPDADDPFAAGAWARTPPPHYDEPPAPVTPWVSPATNA